MGSKTKARELMKEAGVPIVPGTTEPVEDVAAAKKIIDKDIGYPIAVKAAGGGGGKGFRVAESEDELEKAFEGAAREGEKFFSDATVYIERYLPDPRHVEVQVLADSHGNVVHLFERDCSVQRRHQKLIEESPAPAVDAELRERIGKIGTEAAKAVGYRSAGTIEGLLQDGEYFFLEMNTRVQVEHCVTEMVTGIDIVREQMQIAAGEELPFTQDDVEIRGHAIECRINAEDASKNFAPAPGKIGSYREPSGPGVRVDSGVEEGSEILPLYDPMIAKLIVWDVDREASTRRMMRALREFEIGGLKTLIPFHMALLDTEQWGNGETCRDLIEDKEWLKQLAFDPPPAADDEDEEPKVERDYAVEVSGKRFDVKVIGAALPNGGAPAAGAAKKAPKRRERGAGRGRRRPGRDRLADPGHRAEGRGREGRRRRGGRAHLRRRGDEDGERDHGADRRQGRGAERLRGRLDRHRRHDRRHQVALAARGGLRRALLHLLGWDVLDVRGDVPHVPEGILEASRAIAVELVLQRLPLGGARVERLPEDAVDVLDVDVYRDGCAACRLGTDGSHLGMFVSEHHDRIADLELGMADFSARPAHSHALLRAEHRAVELDRVACAVTDQVWGHPRVTLRNRFDHWPSLPAASESGLESCPACAAPSYRSSCRRSRRRRRSPCSSRSWSRSGATSTRRSARSGRRAPCWRSRPSSRRCSSGR